MMSTCLVLLPVLALMRRGAALTGMRGPEAIAGIGTGFVVVLVLLLGVLRVRRTARALREASCAGRRASAQQTGANLETSFSRDGEASDPLNVKITGTAGQLAASFVAAGWYRADEIDFVTLVRISVDSVLGRKYSTAPVSNLYLYGRKEDFAFERPGTSVRERDHMRFWNTGATGDGDRAVWIGGATHDIKVEISKTTHLPTLKIAPDVDDERQTVLDMLIECGWVVGDGWEPGFGRATEQHNSLGDEYHTDERRAVLTLANIVVLAPVTTHVRGRLALRIAQALGSIFRGRLPSTGRERAARHRAERLARVQLGATVAR
jgi:hypothetical protein